MDGQAILFVPRKELQEQSAKQTAALVLPHAALQHGQTWRILPTGAIVFGERRAG